MGAAVYAGDFSKPLNSLKPQNRYERVCFPEKEKKYMWQTLPYRLFRSKKRSIKKILHALYGHTGEKAAFQLLPFFENQ